MKIKAVEELLGLSRANIRFYEDKGLLSPDRSENRYREYGEADIERLKKIIILRKMGISIEDIGSLFDGRAQLSDVLQKQATELQSEIEHLSGALALCNKLAESGIGIDTLDEDAYMAVIEEEEKAGAAFIDICKDYIEFEANRFLSMWKYNFFIDLKPVKSRWGWWGVAGAVLVICIIRGLAKQFLWKSGSFTEGFLYPFLIFLIASAVITPLYFLGRKHPKLAGVIASILQYVCIAFLALIAIAFVLLLLNQAFHF